MSFLDITQAALPAVGMGVGAAFGGMPGAMVGTSAGTAVSSGIGMFRPTPKTPGVSGARRQALGVSTHLMENLASLRGATPEQIQNLMEISRGATMETMAMLNVLPSQMNPIDRANIVRGLQSEMKSRGIQIDKLVDSYDPRAESARIASLSSVAGQVSSQATSIDEHKHRQEMIRRETQAAREHAMAQAFQSLTSSIVMQNQGKKPEASTPTEAGTPMDRTMQTQEPVSEPWLIGGKPWDEQYDEDSAWLDEFIGGGR